MADSGRILLVQRLEKARGKIEKILPRIDPSKDIYPGWTIKEMLAHITGWDDICLDTLCAHESGNPPSNAPIHNLDKCNEESVSSRKGLSYEQILQEWCTKRHALLNILNQLPDEKFHEPIAVPWGKKTTVTKLVDIFSEHEQEHAHDITEWLMHPEEPLGKEGN
jgi:hypothetical protein